MAQGRRSPAHGPQYPHSYRTLAPAALGVYAVRAAGLRAPDVTAETEGLVCLGRAEETQNWPLLHLPLTRTSGNSPASPGTGSAGGETDPEGHRDRGYLLWQKPSLQHAIL